MIVGVLRGGKTRSTDSHLSAVEILADLRLSDHKVIDITIDETGDWYERGVKTTPAAILPHLDAIINTTKETEHVPLARKLGVKKVFETEPKVDNLRRLLFQLGVKYPSYTVISKELNDDDMHNLWRKLHIPFVVKSQNRLLPSLFTYEPKETLEYIKEIQKRGDTPLIDSQVVGRYYHVAAVSNLRGERVYIPTILESFRKYGKNNYARTQSLYDADRQELKDIVHKIHTSLDAPVAVYDFVKNKNGFTLVHVSTRPNYYEGTHLHEAFKGYGVTFREIIESLKDFIKK